MWAPRVYSWSVAPTGRSQAARRAGEGRQSSTRSSRTAACCTVQFDAFSHLRDVIGRPHEHPMIGIEPRGRRLAKEQASAS